MIHTPVCDVLGITHPICQAGMAGYVSPELASAVSRAGGLGVLGGLSRTADEIRPLVRATRDRCAGRPYGVNQVMHFVDDEAFEACLEEGVPVFSFSWGNPAHRIRRAHEAGAKVICQVTTVAEVPAILDAGADVLVAQGVEGGGHSGFVPLLALLPAVVELASSVPVLAAGGIVDGKGLAAAMAMGASGAWMGTRFLATPEANARPSWKRAIVEAGPEDTIHSLAFDTLAGRDWPGSGVRAIKNRFTEEWDGRELELAQRRLEVQERMLQAEREDDPTMTGLYAGVGVGAIRDIRPAADLVRDIVAEAEAVISSLARLVRRP